MNSPTKLSDLTQAQLDDWVTQAQAQTQLGRLPNYIPLLATADPNWLAVEVRLVSNGTYTAGEIDRSFALMSVVKPFVLLFLLHHLGSERVFAQVGMDPSDQSFHSITQLITDQNVPRNPMINSGAIALAALLPGQNGTERCANLCQWLNQQSGSQLMLDTRMLASVESLGNEANRAIASRLALAGNLNSVEDALDTYNQICCLSGTVADLAQLGLLLVQPQANISPEHQRIVTALMLTCGLYEASGRFAVKIGLPTKSGVSGALLAVIPGAGAIACYSPTLDRSGNSVAGLFLLELLARSLDLSVFS